MFRERTLDVLQKQYGYTNISDLLLKKSVVLDAHFGDIAESFVTEILDFDTCIPAALDYYWGKVFKLSRTFTDDEGNEFSLSDAQFRTLIKIRAFGTRWNGSALMMNEFLKELYRDRGTVYMVDRQNMTVQTYVFLFQLEPWERYLFIEKDVLPRPAGIGTAIYEITTEDTFGFHNTELQPFNQGVFWRGKSIY